MTRVQGITGMKLQGLQSIPQVVLSESGVLPFQPSIMISMISHNCSWQFGIKHNIPPALDKQKRNYWPMGSTRRGPNSLLEEREVVPGCFVQWRFCRQTNSATHGRTFFSIHLRSKPKFDAAAPIWQKEAGNTHEVLHDSLWHDNDH